jgi:hypothetical protein
MIGYIILGVVLGLPLLLGVLFRVSTSFLFLSLLAGELLGRTFHDEAELIIGSAPNGHAVAPYSELAIIVLPVLLTALFLRRTLSKGKMLLHLLPFALTGIIFAAFALPVLPEVAKVQVTSVDIGRQLLDNSQLIVGVVVFLQLIALWLINRPKESHGKKHH